MRLMWLLVFFILFSCGAGYAAASPVSVTVPVFTKHFPRSADLNEHNRGIGLEYSLNKQVALTAGVFNNSFRKDTLYAGVIYTPFHVLGLHTGIVLGLDLNGGYRAVNPFHPLLGALHFGTDRQAPLGFNIDILPGGGIGQGDMVYGAVAVSMKYSF